MSNSSLSPGWLRENERYFLSLVHATPGKSLNSVTNEARGK